MSRSQRGGLSELFAEPSATLHAADVALCNLEGPLSLKTNHRSRVQAAAFRGVPEFRSLLIDAGFTHINIANNHILQHGPSAFDETVDVIQRAGLKVIGLSGTQESQISRPVVSCIRNRRICIVGYSLVPDVRNKPPLPYANSNDIESIAAEISTLSRGFDDVIVSCHAGDEGLLTPSPAIIHTFRKFVDAGARCVLGHHSHVFQPVERYRDGLIAYSLGNFAFDLFWDVNATRSAILLVKMHPGGNNWELIPTEFTREFRVRTALPHAAAAFRHSLTHATTALMTMDDREYTAALLDYERRDRYAKSRYFLNTLLQGNVAAKLEFLISKVIPWSHSC